MSKLIADPDPSGTKSNTRQGGIHQAGLPVHRESVSCLLSSVFRLSYPSPQKSSIDNPSKKPFSYQFAVNKFQKEPKLMPLYPCAYEALAQNKPNPKNLKTNATSVNASNYERNLPQSHQEKQSQTNPNPSRTGREPDGTVFRPPSSALRPLPLAQLRIAYCLRVV